MSLAVPTVPGVSFSAVSASVKPLSRVTEVELPVSDGIEATGFGLEAFVVDEELEEL